MAIGYNPTPFLTLTAVARETEQIRLATQPLLLPLYHPVHVAEQLAVLDLLSNGRAMLGVGVGYREGDFEAFGVPRHERGARTDEALTILLGALRERGFSHQGSFHQVRGVDITPRPLQQPHPKIYVTARSRGALRRAVRFGLGVNTLHREAIGSGVYAAYCDLAADTGVDPSTLDFTIVRNGYLAQDTDEAVRMAGPYIEGRTAYMAAGEFAGRDEHARGATPVATAAGASFATEGELNRHALDVDRGHAGRHRGPRRPDPVHRLDARHPPRGHAPRRRPRRPRALRRRGAPLGARAAAALAGRAGRVNARLYFCGTLLATPMPLVAPSPNA